MLLLTSTSDLLKVITGSALNTDVHADWVDNNAGTITPGRTNTAITTAATTTVVASPGASTQRNIQSLSIRNTDAASTNAITVTHFDGTTNSTLIKVTLNPGYTLQYGDSVGWNVLDGNGNVQYGSGVTAAGSTTQIQFNDGGTVLGGDADFTWDKTNNLLTLGGTDTGVLFKNVTNEPTAPSAGYGRVYTKSVSGKTVLKVVGVSGLDSPLQNAIWQNNTVLYTPAAAAGVWQGTVGSNLGTPTIVLPTTTNIATMLRRSNFPTVVTTANQQVGTRSEAMFFRGNATGVGGFLFACRFMFTSYKAGNRLFVGLCSGTTAVVTVDPSGLTNMLGFGIDAADSAITFMHNDAAGTCTKDTIAGQPALANNNGYAAYIFCKPNDSTVYYRLDNLNTQATIIDTSTTTDLPVNTTALTAQCITGNGANVVAGDAAIGINRIYLETDN